MRCVKNGNVNSSDDLKSSNELFKKIFKLLNLFNRQNGVRVLLYHSITNSPVADALTTSPEDFERQISSLKKAGYAFISLVEWLNQSTESKHSSKTIAITFDDGYTDQHDFAYPVLQAYQIPATIFLPTAFLGDASRWDQDKAKPIMSTQTLQCLDTHLITFGLHTHQHINYEVENLDFILKDLEMNIQCMQQQNIPFLKALAYPYGKRPKDPSVKKQLFERMRDLGIDYGFRIGNRINKNINAPYEIQRIDVRGTDSFETVMRKIRYGKMFF